MIRPDRIEVRRIRALGNHGALVGEQDQSQPFEIDLDIYLDLGPAATNDDLSATVDYGQVSVQVADLVSSTRFFLLEALAGAIADTVLADGRIQTVEVTIRKLRPPVCIDVATVGVRLSRSRDRADGNA